MNRIRWHRRADRTRGRCAGPGDLLGLTWSYSDLLGLTRSHSELLGLTWSYSDVLGLDRIYSESLGFNRTYWDLPGLAVAEIRRDQPRVDGVKRSNVVGEELHACNSE